MLGLIVKTINNLLDEFDGSGIIRVEGEVSSILTKNTACVEFNDSYEKVLTYVKDRIVKGYVVPVIRDGRAVGGIETRDTGRYHWPSESKEESMYSSPCPYRYVSDKFDPHIPVIDIRTTLEAALPLILNGRDTFSQRAIITKFGEVVGSVSLINFPNHLIGNTSNPQDSFPGGPDNQW